MEKKCGGRLVHHDDFVIQTNGAGKNILARLRAPPWEGISLDFEKRLSE